LLDEMLMPVELLVFLGIWLSSRFLLKWWNGQGKESRRYPPSLPSLPLVGSLPFLRGFNNIAEFFMKKADEHGPIFTFRAGNMVVLILSNREVIEDALVNHSSSFSGRAPFYTESVLNPKRKGLSQMQTSQEWKKYHQLSLSTLKEFGFGVKSMMESRILTEVEFFTEHVLKLNGNFFDPRELTYLSISNIIFNILFGRRQHYKLGMTALGRELKRFFDNFNPALDVAPILRFIPFHRNKLHELIQSEKLMREIIQSETEKSMQDGAEDCFVRRYIEREGKDYDAEQLSFTLRDLVAAGTDTTANTLLWTLIALANNPDVQDRLRAEVDHVVPRDRLPSMHDQSKMPFTEATILEILRWKTLVPLAIPHTTLTDTNVGDYFVPAGVTVLVNLHAANMDAKVFKDPEIFRPERFLDKDGQVINRDSVITFSLGRRSCLGEIMARAELFLFLTGLVQRFIIRPPEGQDIVEDKQIEPVMLILASAPFNIRMIARD
jgi:cytochrome P450